MYNLVEIKPNTYENFISINPHFYKSYYYNEYLIKEKKYYLGLINEKKQLLAATILIENKQKHKYKEFTSIYGYTLNYNDNQILKEFHKQIKTFLKQKKGISLTISPNIKENEIIINNLEKLNYKIKQITNKNNYISLDDNINNTLTELKKLSNKNYQVQINNLEDISKEYINLHNDLNKEHKSVIFTTKLFKEELLKKLKNDLKTTINQISILPLDNLSPSAKIKLENLTTKKNNINEEIKKVQTNKDVEIISINILIIYKNEGYILPIQNNNLINYNTMYEELNYLKDNNIKKVNILEIPKFINKEELNIKEESYINTLTYIPNKLLYKLFKKEN